jgi:hypothetical protein
MLWVIIAVIAVLFVASITAGVIQIVSGRSVALSGSLTSLTIGPSKNGDHLFLTGDSLALVNANGTVVAHLTDTPNKGPILAMDQWVRYKQPSWVAIVSGKKASNKLGPPKKVASISITPSTVLISHGKDGTAEFTSEGGEGPRLLLSENELTGSLSPFDLSLSYDCFSYSGTCFQKTASLDTAFGLQIKTCVMHNGLPLNSTNKDVGCKAISAGDLGALHISLQQDGNDRLTIGSSQLTSPRVGGSAITPLSQITAFDKKGVVVWKVPHY